MKNPRTSNFVAALVFAALVCSAPAQTFSIDWSTIDGGGWTSTGGAYSLSGTIGQPDAGPALTGGNFSVTGGFWVFSVVQTAGAPSLTIFSTATNTVVVSWPSPSTGFNPQQNTNLNGAAWTTPSDIVNDNGATKFIIINPSAGNRFFRLSKP
jgi:hypothetical protein